MKHTARISNAEFNQKFLVVSMKVVKANLYSLYMGKKKKNLI